MDRKIEELDKGRGCRSGRVQKIKKMRKEVMGRQAV